MITAEQRHQLIVADRTRDIDVIGRIVDSIIDEGDDTTPLDVEMAFRDAAAQTYLIAEPAGVNVAGVSIVLGMPAWRDALEAAGMTPEQNRAALAALFKE